MWIAARVAHVLAEDGALSLSPVALIGVLALSYVMRPPTRRGCPRPRAERAPPVSLCNEEWDRAAAMIPRSGMALPLAAAGPREETPCRGRALEWSSTNWLPTRTCASDLPSIPWTRCAELLGRGFDLSARGDRPALRDGCCSVVPG